jgi:hypothetical protein
MREQLEDQDPEKVALIRVVSVKQAPSPQRRSSSFYPVMGNLPMRNLPMSFKNIR